MKIKSFTMKKIMLMKKQKKFLKNIKELLMKNNSNSKIKKQCIKNFKSSLNKFFISLEMNIMFLYRNITKLHF